MSLPTAAPQRDVFAFSDRLLAQGPAIRSTVIAVVAVAALAFGGFGWWAATAPLASGAAAPGMVRVDTNRKTVQHLEGGIIREILVREGDRVRAGQVLVRLDPVVANADRSVLENQLFTAMAEEARLLAERDGARSISYPSRLLARRAQPAVAALMRAQDDVFRSQRSALEGDIAVLQKKIAQQHAQIDALLRQVTATEEQLRLFTEELQTARELLAKGYERRPRVMELQRNVAQVQGESSGLRGRIETARETISEARAQIETLRRQRARAVSDDLEKARTRRTEAEQQLEKTTDRLKRIEVLAPQAGKVLAMKYFAPGAVVPPGGVILDIVPDNENMVMYVRVSPLDIDVVREGLAAEVRLVAYRQRLVPTLAGRVTQVSADAVIDEMSKGQFFMARVEVPPAELARVPGVKLYPGMPVEAIILTGERTVLDYLIRPLLDSFAHAFREQ